MLRSVFENITYNFHAWSWRIDVCISNHELLENIILNGASQFGAVHTLLVGHSQIHGVDDGGRTVDGEGRGYFGKV